MEEITYKQIKFDNQELALLVLLTITVMISGYFLFFDSNLISQSKLNRPPAAELTDTTNLVRAKRPTSFIWENVGNNIELFSQDQIYTHQGSSAKLELSNGSQIELGENTLFKLEKKENSFAVGIAKGVIHTNLYKNKDNLTVNFGSKIINLKGKGKIRISNGDSKEKISVLEGSLNLEFENGKRVQINKNQEASLGIGNSLKIEQIKFILNNPLPGQKIYYQKETPPPVEFKVHANLPVTGLKIAISKTQDFKEQKLLQMKDDHIGLIPKELTEGKFYWKAIAQNSQKEEIQSDISSFYYIQEPELTIFSPIDKKVILKNQSSKSKEINFEWQDAMADNYLMQVKNISTGKVDEMNFTKNFGQIKLKNEGEYQFRLKISSTQRPLALWSNWQQFKIKTIPDFKKWELISPPSNTAVHLSNPKEKITLRWEGGADGINIIEISTDVAFSNIIHQSKIKEKNIEWNPSKPGIYFWRVKSEFSEIPLSSIKRLEIKRTEPLPPPELPSKIKVKAKVIKVKSSFFNLILETILDTIFSSAYANESSLEAEIGWPAIENATQYVIEVYSTNENKLVLKETTSQNVLFWKGTKPGQYKFRIAVIDTWGQEGEFSNFSNLEINAPVNYFQIEKPKLWTPAHGITVYDKEELNFNWSVSKNASRYLFLISKDLEFTEVVFRKETEDNFLSVDLDELNIKGTYFWRVIALNSNEKNLSLRRKVILIQKDNKAIRFPPVANQSIKKIPKWYFSTSWNPSIFSYRYTQGLLKVNANGNLLGAFSLASKIIHNKSTFEGKIDIDNATLLSEHSYRNISLSALYGRNFQFKNFLINASIGPNLTSNGISSRTSNTTIGISQQSFFGVRAKLNAKTKINKNWSVGSILSGTFGSIGQNHLSVKAIQCRLNYSLEMGLLFETASFSKEDYNLETKRLGPTLGIKYPADPICY